MYTVKELVPALLNKIQGKHSTHGTLYGNLKVEWMVLNWICKIKHRMHLWQGLVFKVNEDWFEIYKTCFVTGAHIFPILLTMLTEGVEWI